MIIFQHLVLILVGHFIAAFIVYVNHRFVFHGRLGRFPLLRKIHLKHALHHAHTSGVSLKKHIFAPLWAQIGFTVLYACVGYFVSASLMIGLISFSVYYAHTHLKIHTKKIRTHAYWHHRYHHRHPNVNFSGMYPFIDRLFSTYTESCPRL
jgi:hypothetical protein